jgi:hypothetical protein
MTASGNSARARWVVGLKLPEEFAERIAIVELWLSFLFGSYHGAMVVALTEIVPAGISVD